MTLTDSVETLGVDLRTRVKRLGAKEKARRKKCKVRFSLTFQKNYMKAGVKKSGMMPARTWSSCSGDVSHGKGKIEKTDGSSRGKKEQNLSVLVHGSFFLAWKWKKSCPPWPLSLGQKEFGLAKVGANKKEAWMRQIQEVQKWRQARGLARAVMCETHDLGKKKNGHAGTHWSSEMR